MIITAAIAAIQYQAWYCVSFLVGIGSPPERRRARHWGGGRAFSPKWCRAGRSSTPAAAGLVEAAPVADEDERHQPDAERERHDDAEHQSRPAARAHAGIAESAPRARDHRDDDGEHRNGEGDGDPGRSACHAIRITVYGQDVDQSRHPGEGRESMGGRTNPANYLPFRSAAAFLRSSVKWAISRCRASSSGARSSEDGCTVAIA